MYQFNYVRPKSLADAEALLAQADDPKLLAGGQTLIPTLKQRLAMPSDVIDIGGLKELAFIKAKATPSPSAPAPSITTSRPRPT